MPPKAEDVREEPLTAVLLADSFSKRMAPITTERPKVLLPLVHSPMIEYILEWLETSGVLVVHILACSHADLLKQYLTTSSKWADSELEIHIISSYNCLSAGEALRLVDQEQIIKDDFILVSGDVVTNMKLQEALTAHKKRRSQDKSAIMTLVAMPNADEAQRTLSGLPDLYIALDHSSHRVLSYVPVLDGADRVDLDTAFFSERDSVYVRSDLIDAGIYICAPEVLVLFSDNFDFQHIQRDFIRGVLSEEELGNKLYMHVLRNEFAAHIANFRSYASVSMDVMCRWLYPICPDTNVLPAPQPIGSEAAVNSSAVTDYFFLSGCRYKESMVRVERTAHIGDFTCIGSGSNILDSACITRSIIGRRSYVGSNAQISDSFVMGGVTIGAGAKVTRAIICDGVKIGADAVISEGAVISFNCVVSPGHVVPSHTRITLCTHLNDESDSDGETEGPTGALDADSQDEDQVYGPLPSILQAAEQVRATGASSMTFDAEAVGPQGAGFDYHKQQGVTVSDRDLMSSVALPPVALATQRGTLLGMPAEGPGNRGADDDEVLDDEGDGDPEVIFKREVVETLLRTMVLAKESESAKTSMMDNAVIELNALKIAEVRTFGDCARYVLTALMDLHSTPPQGTSAQFFSLYAPSKPDVSGNAGKAALLQGLKATLAAWRATLKKFLQEDEDQLDLLITLEEYCGGKGLFAGDSGSGDLYVPIFGNVLWELYDMDIITEDVFLDWESQKLRDEADEAEEQDFLVLAKDFLEVLHEDDSDEDDSESEDD